MSVRRAAIDAESGLPVLRAASPSPDHSAVWAGRDELVQLQKDIAHQVFYKRPLYAEIVRACREVGAQRVLEVGAGSAIDSYSVANESGAEHHCMDLAETALALGQRIAVLFPKQVIFHRGDALASDLPDSSFDVVFHQGLLEHFADPSALLTENLRILRPGGILIVDVPQLYSLYTVLKRRKMKNGTWPWGWEREYTVAQMRDLAADRPMELLRLSSWGYDFYTSILRWPWVKFQRRNPWRNAPLTRMVDGIHGRWIEPAWEAGWSVFEKRFGPHVMMNVTGVYRRTR